MFRAAGPYVEPEVQRWVDALLPWAMNDLRHPVSVGHHKDYWRINILGALQVELKHKHSACAIFVRQQHGFVRDEHADLRLRSMLSSNVWLGTWLWRRTHRCGIPLDALVDRIPAVVRSLRAGIDDEVIYTARRTIRVALPLDADILALAIRANPLPILGLEHYVAKVRFRSQMLAREQLVPALLPVFASH